MKDSNLSNKMSCLKFNSTLMSGNYVSNQSLKELLKYLTTIESNPHTIYLRTHDVFKFNACPWSTNRYNHIPIMTEEGIRNCPYVFAEVYYSLDGKPHITYTLAEKLNDSTTEYTLEEYGIKWLLLEDVLLLFPIPSKFGRAVFFLRRVFSTDLFITLFVITMLVMFVVGAVYVTVSILKLLSYTIGLFFGSLYNLINYF